MSTMTFSDDDLKRLKHILIEDKKLGTLDQGVFIDELLALLARLEAAERFLEGYSDLKDDPTYEAWRKAAGK